MIIKKTKKFFKRLPITDKQKGSSLLFTILIMSFIMGISFGVSFILFQEIKMTRDIGNSIVALFAAETGIEKVMMSQDDPYGISECFGTNICYEVITETTDCQAQNYCLKSTGTYKNTKRAIEIQY